MTEMAYHEAAPAIRGEFALPIVAPKGTKKGTKLGPRPS
jgi:hypothetical protein